MADELSRLLGTTKTNAVRTALERALVRAKRDQAGSERLERIMQVSREFSSQITDSTLRSSDADKLYGDDGLPIE